MTRESFTVHRYGTEPAQFGELWLPDGAAAGIVVVIHGGFWRARYDLSLGRPLAADLAARGYAAWNLEYRRALAGGGWPGTFEDVAAGIDLLAALPVDTSRVVAVGHSAGGHLAAWAAGRAKLPPGAPGAPAGREPSPADGGSGRAFVAVTGVIAQAGVLALGDCAREHVGGTAALDLMGGGPDELPEEYCLADPIAAVPIPAPVVCLHSRADANVPYSYSERYVAAASAAGGQATLTETHGDHFTLIDPASADWAAAIGALPVLLSLGSAAPHQIGAPRVRGDRHDHEGKASNAMRILHDHRGGPRWRGTFRAERARVWRDPVRVASSGLLSPLS